MDELRYWFWTRLNFLLRHAGTLLAPPPRKAYVVTACHDWHRRHPIDNKGFTLIEILVATFIMTVVSGIAAEIVTNVIPTVHADSSLEMAVAQLRQAREGAIDQRRNFVVTFKGTNEITVVRQELDGSLTPISDVFLGDNVVYTLITGVLDTPDNFGNTLAVNFAGGNTVTFLGDGTAVDSTNKLVNGTVFMAIPGKPLTVRAITVMGATSRIKGYRYNGSKWF